MFSQRSPIIIVQNVIGAIVGYVGLLFILRDIGTLQWGFVSFGIGFVGVLSVFGDLGYSTAHSIKVSQGEDIGTCNGTFLTIKLILGLTFIALVFAVLEIWTRVLHRGFESPLEYYVALALIPYYFFQSFTGFTTTYFKAKLKSVRASVPPIVEAILRNSIFVFLALIVQFNVSNTVKEDAAIFLAGTYSITYSVYFVTSYLLGRPWEIRPATKKMLREYTAIALPLMILSGVGTLNGNIDKVVIQFFWGAVATGAFLSMQTISNLIGTLGSSMSTFFLPLLVRLHRQLGKEAHNRSIFEFERLISLYLLPFVVVLAFLSKYVLNIFTGAYVDYSTALTLLSVRAYISAINSPYYSSIASRMKTKLIATIDMVFVAMNIVLILVLVPTSILGFRLAALGTTGAALAMLITGVLSNATYRVVVNRMEHIGYNTGMVRQIVPVAVMLAFLSVIVDFVNAKPFFTLLGISLVSIAIYFLMAVAIRETSFKEIISVARSFDPRLMAARFREERSENENDISEVLTETSADMNGKV
ncbi:oligosaccharide flippase family protein [Thermoplasmatales archaeon AK]|nr:oligosaccharide flippase family protein [Thermoplasmatales archaeon AK]